MVEQDHTQNERAEDAPPEGGVLSPYEQLLSEAQAVHKTARSWVEFYRAVLSNEGLVPRAFPSRAAYEAFLSSPQYARIESLLGDLRKQRTTSSSDDEPTRVITVRLPKSMHETLRAEAHDHRTSINQLCITKLLAPARDCSVPLR